MDTSKYIVRPGDRATTIDLDEEDVRLPDGSRLTEEHAERLAREGVKAAREANLLPGGKSMSPGLDKSPQLALRVPADVKQRLQAIADERHMSVSKLARSVLEDFVRGAA